VVGFFPPLVGRVVGGWVIAWLARLLMVGWAAGWVGRLFEEATHSPGMQMEPAAYEFKNNK
jgi:hypothetical protein